MAPPDVTITEPTATALCERRQALEDLLADAVDDNASVGYIWPLDPAQFAAAWEGWIADVERGERYVIVAQVGEAIAGCVHLVPCPKPNQPHRADVAKLLVHRRFRRRGIARALMRAVEAKALALGRTLVTLDTRTGSEAEALYRAEGWTALGVVPAFAFDPDGTPGDCTFFWKRLAAMR
jgi:GNAT superfamily N-acetyltransferase